MKQNISDTSKELLQIYTKEVENLHNERDNSLKKIKKVETKHLSYKNSKQNHDKFKYYPYSEWAIGCTVNGWGGV